MMTVTTIVRGYHVYSSVQEAAVCLASGIVATRIILTLLPLLMDPEMCRSIYISYLFLVRNGRCEVNWHKAAFLPQVA